MFHLRFKQRATCSRPRESALIVTGRQSARTHIRGYDAAAQDVTGRQSARTHVRGYDSVR
jgi:hypothetical protein